MAKNTRYTDFDLNFTKHPVTGDVSLKTDENAIKQSLKNLIQTKPFENPFEPDKGSKVMAFLFELVSPIVALGLKDSIKALVDRFEPRVELIDISVFSNIDDNGYEVTILFNMVNVPDVIRVDFFLERLR